MEKIMKKIGEKNFYIIMSAVVIFAACLPVYGAYCLGGHDVAYHLLRIESLKNGILAGKPFLKVNMLFFGGMGYASSLFYPDFLLYIPAVLRSIGVSIDHSYNLFVVFCIIAGYVSCYFSVRHITKSDRAALVSAVIFTLYQYHIDDIYTRAAVGEYTAVIFVPLVMAGLFDLMYEGDKGQYLLFAGMTGVLLCHTLTIVICFMICLCFFFINIKRFIAEPKRMITIVLTAVAVLLFTSAYWLPVVEQFSTGAFAGNDTYFDLAHESKLTVSIFYNENTAMGIAVWLLLLSRLMVKKVSKEDRLINFADVCSVIAIVFSLLSTNLFPWGRFQGVLGFLQFPWRLLVITGPLLSFAEGIYINRVIENEAFKETAARAVMTGVAAVMLCSAVANLERNDQEYYSYSDDYYDHIPFTGEVIGGEWLPAKVDDREHLMDHVSEALTDAGETIGVEREANRMHLRGIPQGTQYVDAPYIYYKGYEACDEDTGKALKISDEGYDGTIRVYTEGAENIKVYYAGTLLQHVSLAISVTAAFCIAVVLALSLIKRRHKDNGVE